MLICASSKNVLKSSRKGILRWVCRQGRELGSRVNEGEEGEKETREKREREMKESVWNVTKQREEINKQIDRRVGALK